MPTLPSWQDIPSRARGSTQQASSSTLTSRGSQLPLQCCSSLLSLARTRMTTKLTRKCLRSLSSSTLILVRSHIKICSGTSNYAITNEKCQKLVEGLKRVNEFSLNETFSATQTTRTTTPLSIARSISTALREPATHEWTPPNLNNLITYPYGARGFWGFGVLGFRFIRSRMEQI